MTSHDMHANLNVTRQSTTMVHICPPHCYLHISGLSLRPTHRLCVLEGDSGLGPCIPQLCVLGTSDFPLWVHQGGEAGVQAQGRAAEEQGLSEEITGLAWNSLVCAPRSLLTVPGPDCRSDLWGREHNMGTLQGHRAPTARA